MRELADAERIGRFMTALGAAARGETTVYFTGGTTAVLCGWRPTTIDPSTRVLTVGDDLVHPAGVEPAASAT